jgi:hypothetical protein
LKASRRGAATIIWFIVLARDWPASIGGATTVRSSPLWVGSIAAIVLMLLMTVHSLIAARRAMSSLPELD